MVLFYEDEKKFKPPLTKARRRLRLCFRVFLVIGVMFGLSLVFMNVLGGSSDSLRAGVQDYLRGATGLQAEIGRFEGVTFFPEAGIAVGDVAFRPDAGAEPVATIGSLNFIMGFWDVFFRRGHIRALEIKDAHFDAGVITAGVFDVNRIGIDTNEKEKDLARLAVDGVYGGDPFGITVTLAAHDIGGDRKSFRRPEKSAVSVDSPFLRMAGVMSRARGGGLQFDFSSIGIPEETMKGRAVLKRGREGINLTLDFVSVGGIDKATAALEKIYCAFKPPERALWKKIKVEKIAIDGQPQKIPGECPAAAAQP